MSSAYFIGCLPWVNDRDVQVGKVARVVGGKGGALGKGNADDKSVAHVHGVATRFAFSCDVRGLGCGIGIELQHAVFQVVLQGLVKAFLKQAPALAGCQQGQAAAGFKHGDAADPDGVGMLVVEPRNHLGIWLLLHQG